MAYTIHSEWTDCTFEEKPTSTFTNKRQALRVAKIVAASSAPEITRRIHVCQGEQTIQAFDVKRRT